MRTEPVIDKVLCRPLDYMYTGDGARSHVTEPKVSDKGRVLVTTPVSVLDASFVLLRAIWPLPVSEIRIVQCFEDYRFDPRSLHRVDFTR